MVNKIVTVSDVLLKGPLAKWTLICGMFLPCKNGPMGFHVNLL